MIELEINGKKIEVPEGSMVMEAAQQLGFYVPHFCFHKKLSIAANCRMCLVEIEKMAKPLPACATPVNQGMKVFTNSEKAKKAQQGVMEFLLINHPLDCPICDQGGECQLQDLAVGYGASNSRFAEEKRVVFHKNIGPLISAQEMSRCIHCTRCVRFGQEVAGIMELGMPGRGEHAEITTFLGGAVESELSGNMIDICPVGALTSKPFRYSARTWELKRFKTVSPHDGMGTNIIAQVNSGKVARVVPFENEQINECWISDRDRFSYTALNSDDRLLEPMIKDESGNWVAVDWQEALGKAIEIVNQGKKLGKYGVRGLTSPLCSTEELLLFSQLVKNCGSDSVDFRVWLADKEFDEHVSGVPNLGMNISKLSEINSVFMVGSRLRDEFPLLAQKFRIATKENGLRVAQLNAIEQPLLMSLEEGILEKPSHWVTVLKNILNICQQKNYVSMSGENLDLNKKVQKIVDMLSQNQPESNSSLIIAGPSVFSHPNASSLLSLLSQIAEELKCRFALLPSGGNVSGGFLAKALPESDGYNTTSMFDNANSAFLLLNVEPAKDLNFGLHAVKTMKQSKVGVVAMTSFKSSVADFATVMLPISPFTESAGTYINMEGRAQNVRPVADSQGSSRPAWKILRVMGNLLGIEEFKYENIKDVQKLFSNKINDDSFIKDFNFIVNKKNTINPNNNYEKNTLEFTSFFPIYLSDQIVRRSESLLKTSQSIKPSFRINPKSLDHLSFLNGDIIKLKLSVGLKSEYIEGKYSVDFSVAEGVVAIGQGHPDQNNFSTMNQLVSVVVD
jgi:NADH-quinone oxidoreductase subunit G